MAKKEKKNEKTYFESTSDKIGEIAMHYGFTIIKPPQITQPNFSKAKQFKDFDYYNDALEKVALTEWYMNERLDLETQPVAIHFKKPLYGSLTKKKPNIEMYGFEIMGSSRSTSEALLIKCVLAVLEELGHTDLYVDINSIGDKESIAKFERELNTHYRKNAHILPSKLRQEFKKNYHSFLRTIGEEEKEFAQNIPETVGSLSDIARVHFKEVLESLESFDVMYKIKSNVLSNKLFASYTAFEIKQATKKGLGVEMVEDGELLAFGYRYNYLAKKIGGKREIPSIGVTILIKKNKIPRKKILIKNMKKPKFYLAQLGGTAKLKALNVVEMLRKHKIPVYHSITKDKITGQLNGAEYMKASHVLIMGQKEAVENSMVVRNLGTREQETVSLQNLPEFLKKIHKGKK